MKGLVVYDSNFGNTEKIARALVIGLGEEGLEVDCLKVDQVDIDKLAVYEFIAIGGPTHMAGVSKPMKEFLEEMKAVDVNGKKGFSFDTRNESRFNMFDLNSAAKRIENKMKKMRIKLIRPRQSAIVEGREGPLHDGMEETFRRIGAEIAGALQWTEGGDDRWE